MGKIIIRNGNTDFVVKSEDVILFETQDRRVSVRYLFKGEECVRVFQATMDSIAEQLHGKGFCRISRSYVVSINHIIKLDDGIVYMDDEAKTEISVGRIYMNDLRACLAREALAIL